MAKIYANDFTEQELKDLVDVLQVAARPEAAGDGAAGDPASMSYMNQWAQNFAEVVNGQFRAEMRKRGKEI